MRCSASVTDRFGAIDRQNLSPDGADTAHHAVFHEAVLLATALYHLAGLHADYGTRHFPLEAEGLTDGQVLELHNCASRLNHRMVASPTWITGLGASIPRPVKQDSSSASQSVRT